MNFVFVMCDRLRSLKPCDNNLNHKPTTLGVSKCMKHIGRPVVLCCAVGRRKSASLGFMGMRSDTVLLRSNSDVEVM
jgi:hypothetical protein